MIVRDAGYWALVRERARALGTDGCTAALDVHLDCCYEHDIAYFTGQDVYGTPVTKAETDARFRRCHQDLSPFGAWSPMAWWRWFAVAKLNRRGGWWDAHDADPG
jgi:hypothetical protein